MNYLVACLGRHGVAGDFLTLSRDRATLGVIFTTTTRNLSACDVIMKMVYWGLLIIERFSIDHFHYDVTRAKVSGSCSKDRAQCRAIAGKCQKISRSAMSAKASYQYSRCFTKLCARLLHKFKEIQGGVFYVFFFYKRGIAKCC